MRYLIENSISAQRDLRNIKRYISLDSIQAAEPFVSFLVTKTAILETHPEIGRAVPEFTDLPIREIIIKNYRVIYKIDPLGNKISILRYWHAARGIPRLYDRYNLLSNP